MHKGMVARVAAAGVMFAAAPTLAEAVSAPTGAVESYYIELGQDSSPSAAAAQWKALVQKHKALLGKYHYFPKEILHTGTTTVTRIQAGPVIGKDKAQKICTRLFVEGVPCFVIEGLGNAPPTKVLNLAEESM